MPMRSPYKRTNVRGETGQLPEIDRRIPLLNAAVEHAGQGGLAKIAPARID